MAGEYRIDVIVTPGEATRIDLRSGETLRIESPDGGQGGDMSFLGFDQAVTRNAIGWAIHGRPWLVFSAEPGNRLYNGDGVAMMEVGEKSGDGLNDIMYPGCWSDVYPDGRPGCRDLISASLGIPRAGLTGMLSFMIDSEVTATEYRGLAHTVVAPGDFVSFRALADLTAAVSACPDDEIPGWRPAPLRITVSAS